MASNKRARIVPIMRHLYIIYIYSERRHSALQDYVSFEKSTSGGGFPLKYTFNSCGQNWRLIVTNRNDSCELKRDLLPYFCRFFQLILIFLADYYPLSSTQLHPFSLSFKDIVALIDQRFYFIIRNYIFF